MRWRPGLNGIAQKLRDVIAAHNLPLGVTEEGKDWCIKALHPSDPTTVVRGIPDRSAVPSVFMAYQSTQVVESPDPNKGWEADISLLPSPVCFSAIMATTYDGVSTAFTNHSNAQLAGSTFQAKYSSWKGLAQRWRLAYAAATIYFDAPATANQGTAVVAQYVMRPNMFPCSQADIVNGEGVLADGKAEYQRDVVVYTEADWARGPVAQSMPSSYFGNARDGIYIPLKLTETCQDWIGEDGDGQMGGMVLNTPLPTGPLLGPDAYSPWFAGAGPPYTVPVGASKFPYWDPSLSTRIRALAGSEGSIGTLFYGTTVPHLDPNVATVSFRNLDKAARITIFYRYGWELQVQPGSVLTPQQKLSPRHDAVALDAYFAIAREMKDAYPEEYNSFGKMWDVISDIGKTILPALSAIHPLVGVAGKAVLSAGDALRKRAKKGLETGKNPPAPADAALASALVKKSSPTLNIVRRQAAPQKAANKPGRKARK